MNLSVVIGIFAAVGVFLASILTSIPLSAFLTNWHAFLVVLGSTAAVALICFPMKTLLELSKVLFRRVILNKHNPAQDVIYEIVSIAQNSKNNPAAFSQAATQTKNFFLKEALELIAQGGFDEFELDLILRKRATTFQARYDEHALYFKTLSKFPPAFGLLGTTLGMMGLMQALGTPDSFKLIGPAMATGLGATLLGIAISNFILIPISENLLKINKEDEVMREIVIDGVKMLLKRQHPLLVEEFLKSYLLPNERRAQAA